MDWPWMDLAEEAALGRVVDQHYVEDGGVAHLVQGVSVKGALLPV